jgi:ribosomal protein S1
MQKSRKKLWKFFNFSLQNSKNIILKTGDKVETKIIKFNPKDKRIALGLPTDEA